MKRSIFKYILLFLMALPFTACQDEMITPENGGNGSDDSEYSDVFSVNFMVTLDNMGDDGTRGAANADDPAQIIKNENYIDPERFRVLFFDSDNMFLFESKNRWIKQIDANDSFSSWFVSVPFGAFGNDSYGEGKEYDWDKIRTHLTSNTFKIAILANRPAALYYPGFQESILQLPDGVFKNDGPQWGPSDSGKKSLLDLHHCQYDIIYADKGNHPGGASASYYDFVMGDINTDRPTMGASIHWANMNDSERKSLAGSSTMMRDNVMPGADHPIPMYGIQEFRAIDPKDWQIGTSYDLSNNPKDVYPDNNYPSTTISLLRSCVRVDLIIPKTIKNGAKPKLVSLWYSNVYSRCEPMDTWTPTNQIWNDDHNNCEWKNILNYGPVSSNTYPGNGTTKEAYQQRISWFFGRWKEMGWEFKTRTGTKVAVVSETASTPYPKIFNTCIQRNKVIRCESADVSNLYNDNYWHYVVYTGERNSNDPNTLPDLSKNPYIESFVITWDESNYYCIPLLNYAKNNDQDAANIFGPHDNSNIKGGNWPGAMNTYINTLPKEKGDNLPYPLLRNHIYKFTLTGKTKAGSDDLEGIQVMSEVKESPTIDFSPKLREMEITTVAPTFKVKNRYEWKVK